MTYFRSAEDLNAEIANRVRLKRLAKGMGIAEFASSLDVTQEYVVKLESGIIHFSAALIFTIAESLEEPIAAFFPSGTEI
ncbi:MAG: helix-turn-helix transcriptional regulator [Pseudomonadota bacterium]